MSHVAPRDYAFERRCNAEFMATHLHRTTVQTVVVSPRLRTSYQKQTGVIRVRRDEGRCSPPTFASGKWEKA